MQPPVNSMSFDQELKLKIMQWASESDRPVKISDAKNSKFAVISLPILEAMFAELISEGLLSSQGGRIPLFELTSEGRKRIPDVPAKAPAAEKPPKKRPNSEDHSAKVKAAKKVSPSKPAPLQQRPQANVSKAPSKPAARASSGKAVSVTASKAQDDAPVPVAAEFRLADTPLLNLLDFVNSPPSAPTSPSAAAPALSVISHPTPQPSPVKIYTAIQEEEVCTALRSLFNGGGEVSMAQFIDSIVEKGIVSRDGAASVLHSLQAKNKVMIVEDSLWDV